MLMLSQMQQDGAALEEADRLADLLLARHLLPSKAAADAQHVALAATAGVDYLLTWNPEQAIVFGREAR